MSTPPPQDPTGGSGAPNYGTPGSGGGYDSPPQQNNTPMILSIVGLVSIPFCGGLLSLILGLVAQSKARQLGQSDTLPKVTWIVGACLVALGVIGGIIGVTTGALGSQ